MHLCLQGRFHLDVPGRDRLEDADMEHGCVQPGDGDERELEQEDPAVDVLVRMSNEHHQTCWRDHQKSQQRPWQQKPAQLLEGQLTRKPKHAQVEHGDRTNQQNKAENMNDNHDRVQDRSAHGNRQGCHL